METKIETRGEKYILKIGTSHFNTEVTGIVEADLGDKKTLDSALWNPF